MSGWGATIGDVIANLEVVRGEADNILTAALRDAGDALVQTQRAETINAQAIDTGEYLKSWRSEVGDLEVSVIADPKQPNDATSYGEYVHIQAKYGGPPGLAERVFDDVKQDLQESVTEFVSERVLDLLA